MINMKDEHYLRLRLDDTNMSHLINEMFDAHFEDTPAPEHHTPTEERLMKLEKRLSELES